MELLDDVYRAEERVVGRVWLWVRALFGVDGRDEELVLGLGIPLVGPGHPRDVLESDDGDEPVLPEGVGTRDVDEPVPHAGGIVLGLGERPGLTEGCLDVGGSHARGLLQED